MRKTILVAGAFLLCVLSISYNTALKAQELKTRTVVSGLDIPWEIIWGPDGWIWTTEIGGRVSRINPTTGQIVELVRINDVKRIGEGGLLGMALHPDFPVEPYVFLAYNYDDNGGTSERIVRCQYNGTALVNPVTILSGIRGSSIHNGCRLLFAPDKTLLITTGDAASQNLSQDHASLNGKILRINPDGSIPPDNPWPGSPLYTTGHRNSQGLTFGPQGKLYSSEHGPANDDEVNIIEKGRNYGWPNVHGYCDLASEQKFCEDSSVVEPIAAWTPTIAVCGMVYYNHTAIPEWSNSLLLLTLKASTLYQLRLSEDGRQIVEQKEFFANQFGRLRAICIAPDGRVFISTSNSNNNRIIEITGENQSLQVSPSTVDFGTLRLSQTSGEQTATLTNTGSETLTITVATVTNSDTDDFSFSDLPLPLSLAPQQQHTFAVRFHPQSTGQKQADLLLQHFGGSASIRLQGRKTNKDASIPETTDLGTISAGTPLDITLSNFFTNTGEQQIELRQIALEQPFTFVVPDNLPIVIAQGEASDLRLQATPPVGLYQSTLVATFDEDIQLSAVIQLTVTSASTAVREQTQAAGVLRISPVPATSDIELRIATPHRGTALWSIIDMAGRTLIRREIHIHSDQMAVFWNGRADNGQACPAGTYTAVVEINGQQHTASVVILR